MGATVMMNLNLFQYTAAGATRHEFEDVTIKLMPEINSLSKRVTATSYDYQTIWKLHCLEQGILTDFVG